MAGSFALTAVPRLVARTRVLGGDLGRTRPVRREREDAAVFFRADDFFDFITCCSLKTGGIGVRKDYGGTPGRRNGKLADRGTNSKWEAPEAGAKIGPKALARPAGRVFTSIERAMVDVEANKLKAGQHSMALIFVVDDEPLLLDMTITILKPLGHKVRTFRDPEAAVRAFISADPRPDLIITDYAMHHDMTGIGLIEECRRIQPKQKIILVSGTVDESIYRNSTIRPDRFLSKPYQAEEFTGLIQSVLAS